ncbi:hypothetical protein [Streptomyces sp. 840.1]|uniref:hypothetical protein n=1 Tax=Streptomyces sp. 840.1 TaxID=2485152 RepID=UPI0016164C21|nr:hypothetical protein [Streptomyces sp. 840.1]
MRLSPIALVDALAEHWLPCGAGLEGGLRGERAARVEELTLLAGRAGFTAHGFGA